MINKIKQRIIFLGLIISCLFSQVIPAAVSHDIALNWKTLKSKHVDIHFHDGEQALAEKTAAIAEHWLLELQEELQWKPKDTIEIVLSDEKDYANGFVSSLLTHLRITLYPTAPDESFEFNDWLELLIKHELAHVLQLDKAKNQPAWLKKTFGRHPLLYPNLFQPAWLIEGYATYQETDVHKGIGRGQSSLFHMLMRMEVQSGLKPLEQVNLNISTWPAGSTRYLYGYYFYEFIEATYGKTGIRHFIEQYSKNLIPYRLNQSAQLVYGKNFNALWQDFDLYLKQKFRKEIDQINRQKLVVGKQITSSGYLKQFLQPLDNGDLLYAEYNAIQPPRLLLKKRKRTDVIAEIQTEAHVDYHPESGALVSQIEIYRNTNAFYDLFQVDLKTKKMKRLTRGDRFRKATWNPGGDKILAVYNKLGQHSLVLLNKKGRLIDFLWQGKEGEYLSNIDWSPNGKNLVAAIKRNNGHWNLEIFNIAQRSWSVLTHHSATEAQPQYSADGRFVYYSADYNGVFNIQKIDLNNHAIQTLTHVLGGAFLPKINHKGDLFYIGYTDKGYDIFSLKSNRLSKQKNTIPHKKSTLATTADYKETTFKIYNYSSLSHLSPTWWTPVLTGNPDSTRLGAYTSGSDALNRHAYDLYGAFDFQSTSFSGAINYSFDRWFPILQTHIETNGRKHYRSNTYQFEMLAPLLSRNQRIYLGINVAYEKEVWTGRSSEAVNTDKLVGVGVIYDSRRRELNTISPSHGRLLSATAENSDIFGGDNSGQVFIAKWSEYFSIKPRHVLAFRFVGGFGLEDSRPFQLGGSISDSEYQAASALSTRPLKSTLYNKRRYALRGYPADTQSLMGRRMLMYNLEWRFPLKIVERNLGMFPLGLNQISATLFAEAASIWNTGNSPSAYHRSLGSEVNLHTEWFFHAPLQVRLGYALGFNEGGGHQIYLAFNSSF